MKATRFKGLRKLNFNSSVRDPTFLHEVITYYLFRAEPQGLFGAHASRDVE